MNILFKRIKLVLGKDYPKFKRDNDVYFEVFRLQAVLLSPYITKNMFNFLVSKLLKLEKERLGLDEIKIGLKKDPIVDNDYYM